MKSRFNINASLDKKLLTYARVLVPFHSDANSLPESKRLKIQEKAVKHAQALAKCIATLGPGNLLIDALDVLRQSICRASTLFSWNQTPAGATALVETPPPHPFSPATPFELSPAQSAICHQTLKRAETSGNVGLIVASEKLKFWLRV